MKIAITGASGLIGWHARCWLQTSGHEVVPVSRTSLESIGSLTSAIADVEAVVHTAAMNRGPEPDVEETNVRLAASLCEALGRSPQVNHVVHTNSVQSEEPQTGYGRSKRAAAEMLSNWASKSPARFTDLVLPHVFGECGRPFHNSVVSTFCYKLSRGEEPEIINDSTLELLHAHDVSRLIERALTTQASDTHRPSGVKLSVSALLERLRAQTKTYESGRVPDLRDALDLTLFNTVRSYMFPSYYPVPIEVHADNRGNLFEVVKSEHGGQAFLSTTRPGITRGNHFHFRKFERFVVARGQAVIRVRRLFDSKVHEFRVDGAKPAYIDMPTLHTHNITNVGETELLTLFWSHELFDPADSDTVPENV